MKKPVELVQGTLDMLILKAVSLGGLYGYAGRKRLKAETESWSRFSALVAGVLGAVPEGS